MDGEAEVQDAVVESVASGCYWHESNRHGQPIVGTTRPAGAGGRVPLQTIGAITGHGRGGVRDRAAVEPGEVGHDAWEHSDDRESRAPPP